MDEYIERQAAIEAFENGEADVIENYGDGCDFGFGIKNIKDVLSAIPAADVAPVRHARWEVDESGFLECTNCAWVRYGIPIVEHYPYCPNCGARMDGGADNG